MYNSTCYYAFKLEFDKSPNTCLKTINAQRTWEQIRDELYIKHSVNKRKQQKKSNTKFRNDRNDCAFIATFAEDWRQKNKKIIPLDTFIQAHRTLVIRRIPKHTEKKHYFDISNDGKLQFEEHETEEQRLKKISKYEKFTGQRICPPPGYVCRKCHVAGHFIQDCTNTRKSVPSGIPKSFLKIIENEEDAPEGESIYITDDGKLAIMAVKQQTFIHAPIDYAKRAEALKRAAKKRKFYRDPELDQEPEIVESEIVQTDKDKIENHKKPKLDI